jgi:sugar transferase (PEP-CTERM system associated)
MIRLLIRYSSARAVFILATEAILIALSLVGAAKLRFWDDPVAFMLYTSQPKFTLQILTVIFCFQICCYYNELYNPRPYRRLRAQLQRLFRAVGASCLLLALVYYTFPVLHIGRGVLFLALGLVLVSWPLSRWLVDMIWKNARSGFRVAIVGSGKLAQDLEREIAERPDLTMRLAGLITVPPSTNGFRHESPILGTVNELSAVIEEHRLNGIIVALEDQRNCLPLAEILRLRTHGLKVDDAHTTMAMLTGRVFLETVRPSWFIFSDGFHRSRLTVLTKRLADIVLSLAGLILSAPLMVLSAVLVKLTSSGPILYRQCRVGLDGKCFYLLKLRTMVVDAEKTTGPQWAQENDPRVTYLGKYLRRYRIDELPQFINVLRGDMSFIGPRPERPEFASQIRKEIPFYDERHSLRPGITGWAQIRYPYGANMQDALRKLEYDLFYLKYMSFMFDCHILLRTVKTVCLGHGGR